jgi:hypothetical protein
MRIVTLARDIENTQAKRYQRVYDEIGNLYK